MDKEIWIQGDVGVIYKDGTVEKEYTSQGVVFKDYNAFVTGLSICYIPELTGDKIEGIYRGEVENVEGDEYAAYYTRKDFLDLVDGNVSLAGLLFEMVDWQMPETLLEEMSDLDDDFAEILDRMHNLDNYIIEDSNK